MFEGPKEENRESGAAINPQSSGDLSSASINPGGLRRARFIDPVLRAIDLAATPAEVRVAQSEAAERLEQKFELSAVLARILAARGFDADERAARFLKPSLGDIPAPKTIKNIDKAVELIAAAIEKKQKILVGCDYDVDGTTAAAIMSTFIRDMGGKVDVFTPDRFRDGYGMSLRHAHLAADGGYDLLLTLDFGTKNKKEIDLARDLARAKGRELKVVVIDHHLVPDDEAPCEAFVNPMQKGCGYADGMMVSGGLAFVSVLALKERLEGSRLKRLAKKAKIYCVEDLLPFAALATVSDMGPLVGPNRVLAKLGSRELELTQHEGLKALRGIAGVNRWVTGADIGYALGPRINAAGRVGSEDVEGVPGAMIAFNLLTCADDRVEAERLARKLNEFNEQRKGLQKTATVLAKTEIAQAGAIPPVFVLYIPGLHEGVVGIVAAKIMQDYWRPTLVMTDAESGTVKGSARSIPGVHVTHMIESLQHLIIKAGGHEAAAGLSLKSENFDAFKEALLIKAAEALSKVDLVPCERWDARVSFPEIKTYGVKLLSEMNMIEPAGRDNPSPQLLVEGARIMTIQALGKGHTRMLLEQGGEFINAFWWHREPHSAIGVNSVVDLVCQLDVDKKRGQYDPSSQHIILNLLAVQPAQQR